MSFLGLFGSDNSYQASNPYDVIGGTGPGGPGYMKGTLGNQGTLWNEQQDLATQLKARADGTAPSLSGQMLAQALAQQQAGANSMAAGNRGVNPGLALRQAQYAQAQMGQNSAATAANARIAEQQQAQSNLQNLYANQSNQNLGQQGLYNQASLGAQGINSNVAAGNQNTSNSIFGNVLGAGALALPFLAMSGKKTPDTSTGTSDPGTAPNGPGGNYGLGVNTQFAAHGGKIGEHLLHLGRALMSQGGYSQGNMKEGGSVPGKAKKKGDSYDNDTVPTMLSPGEIVVPRSASEDSGKAKAFIDHLMKKEGKSSGGYGNVLKNKRGLEQRVAHLEKMLKEKHSG